MLAMSDISVRGGVVDVLCCKVVWKRGIRPDSGPPLEEGAR
jgi:hypothetical protein